MSKVATESPDRPDSGPLVISRQADTQKSDAHVAQLMSIAEHCSKWLWSRTEPGETLDVDKALQHEARKTMELVHLRLRELVDEQRRWSLDPSHHEREATKLVDSTLSLYDQKTINAKIYNRPHIFLRPKIMRIDLGWCVWVGGDMPRRMDLHGIGDSPALAMKAFDDAYYALEKIADAQPAVVVPPYTPPKPPKKRRVRRSPSKSETGK